MSHRDLSLEQQEHVRVCLRALRARFGNWRNVERSLPVAHSVLVDVLAGKCEVSIAIAFRTAKVLDATSRRQTPALNPLPQKGDRCLKRPIPEGVLGQSHTLTDARGTFRKPSTW